jgi:hypothetical protein
MDAECYFGRRNIHSIAYRTKPQWENVLKAPAGLYLKTTEDIIKSPADFNPKTPEDIIKSPADFNPKTP